MNNPIRVLLAILLIFTGCYILWHQFNIVIAKPYHNFCTENGHNTSTDWKWGYDTHKVECDVEFHYINVKVNYTEKICTGYNKWDECTKYIGNEPYLTGGELIQ